MPELRDSAIKLFGRAIPLSVEFAPPVGGGAADLAPAMEEMKDGCKEKFAFPGELKRKEPAISYGLKISGEHEQEASTVNAENAEELMTEHDHKETDTSDQNKVLKKPDKILPCPRCNSMDTKFCYYNNYNVNQPRHFCKNCQRYWTAGGTMRNVPVGAGRRKNKHSCSDYHQTSVTSDFLVSAQVDNSDLTHLHPLAFEPHATEAGLKGDGSVLKFEPDLPLYESKISVMKLGEHKRSSEEPSCASSLDASNHVDNGTTDIAEHNAMQGYLNGVMLMRNLQCLPFAWAYPLNLGWNNVNAASAASTAAGICSSDSVSGKEKSFPTPMPMNPSHVMASPAFYAPAFPFPLAPASFWGSMPCWNPPWIEFCNGLSPLSSTKTDNCSGNNSPTLGKHSRDAGLNREGNMEKSLWFPKTLRIDDPDEAAMSPIFATLGIKPYEAGVFQSFQPKFGNEEAAGSSHVLRANPAALSRSQSFQETI